MEISTHMISFSFDWWRMEMLDHLKPKQDFIRAAPVFLHFSRNGYGCSAFSIPTNFCFCPNQKINEDIVSIMLYRLSTTETKLRLLNHRVVDISENPMAALFYKLGAPPRHLT